MELNYILSLLTGIILGLLAAHLALRKERNPTIWFLVGLLMGLIGIAILFFLPPVGFGGDKEEKKKGVSDKEPSNTPSEAASIDNLIMQHLQEEGPRALEDNDQWFYLDAERRQQGPLSLENLRAAWRLHQVTPTSYVWCPLLSEWMTVETLPSLHSALMR